MAEDAFCDAVCTAIGEPSPKPVALPQLSPQSIAEQYLQLYHLLLFPASASDTPARPAEMRTSQGDHLI
jgi:hypothetical protein